MDVPVTLIAGLCRKLLLPGESGVGFSFSSCIENPLLMSFWGEKKKSFNPGILLCFLRLLLNCLHQDAFKINITSVLYILLGGWGFLCLAIDFWLYYRTLRCTLWWRHITSYMFSWLSLSCFLHVPCCWVEPGRHRESSECNPETSNLWPFI